MSETETVTETKVETKAEPKVAKKKAPKPVKKAAKKKPVKAKAKVKKAKVDFASIMAERAMKHLDEKLRTTKPTKKSDPVDDRVAQALALVVMRERKKQGLSTRELAVKCRLDSPRIVRLEQALNTPTFGRIAVVAKGLGLTTREMLTSVLDEAEV